MQSYKKERDAADMSQHRSGTVVGISSILRAKSSLVSVFLLLAQPALIHAQTATPPPGATAAEGLRRQEERLKAQLQQQAHTQDVLKPESKEALVTSLPDEAPCFVIEEFQLTGKSAAQFGWLQNVLEPYRGRCIGVEGVRRLATLLDAKLIEWGYATTNVSLPAQNLSSGILNFHLHVGRVAAIRMVKAGTDATDEAWGTWKNAFPVSAENILNIRDLEQGTEQMQRLPSQAVRNRIEPGEEPDTSVVIIERQSGSLPDRIRGGLTLDNSGTGLGRPQFSGNLSLDNLFGLNDILALNGSSNVENLNDEHRSQSASINYSIPFGYSTFSYTRSENRYAQIVQGTTARFLSSGSSSSDQFRFDHIALRNASSKFGVYVSLSTRRAESYLDDVELLVQRRRTTNFEVGGNYKKLIGDASFNAEIGYRRGVPWRHAQEDFDESVAGLTLRPKLWLLTASFNQPFSVAGQVFQYTAALSAQHTKDVTTSNDQFSIGSRYTVRGFDGKNVLLAESGYTLRNDIATPVSLMDGVNAQAYIGVDIGRVWGASDAVLIGHALAGTAIGIRSQWKNLQWDAAAGTPLYKPHGFATQGLNAYLSVSYLF